MTLFRVNINRCPRLVSSRYFATALQNEEYTATPQYPPILDLSLEKKWERKKEAIHEEIKAVKTVEEKQIKLNMPRFYGYKSYMLHEDSIPYNSLTFAQHATRTHLIVNNNLPDYYKNIKVDELMDGLKNDIEEAVIIEYEGYKRKHDLTAEALTKSQLEDVVSSSLSKQINRIVFNKLSKSYKHLLNAQVDYDPRIESTWYVGGMNPPRRIISCRKGREWMKPYVNDPVDRLIVYIGSPTLTVRSNLPLPTIVSPSEAENPSLDVPFFQYDPRVIATKTEHRHMANIPGFWPGDKHQFGLLSYHKRGHIHTRERFKDTQDDKEALHRQGILASFGWLQAQANLLGFNTFNDITYPLINQSVISNGKMWSFYVYQMNTMLFHSKYIHENPKRNICWATEELKLFEEIVEGKLVGLNEDVIKLLIQFYANIPESRLGINLCPYLSNQEKVIADYQDDDKREWLEREYKFLVSNRPRFKQFYEIYSWEKIYKIDNKTRFMDKRKRPFELFIQPQKRTLDDRQPIYIPRKDRPDVPRWKGGYKKDYFP